MFNKPMVLRHSEFSGPFIEKLQHAGEAKSILPRRRLSLQVGGERYCYIILRGTVTLHRHSDDLALINIPGPAIIGIVNLHQLEIDAYIKTQGNCSIVTLKIAQVHEIIEENKLWELLAKHMMVMSGKLFQLSEQLSAPTAYDIIKTQLYELFHEPSTIRENITAESYIRDKTHLSRSGIMRILGSLKEGGYIEIERGILRSIIKLPERF